MRKSESPPPESVKVVKGGQDEDEPTQIAQEIFNHGVTLPDGTHADGWKK